MAIVSTAIPAVDLAKRALNKPLVVGRNLLELAYSAAAANMVWNTTGTLAAGDASAVAPNDRAKAVDRYRHTAWNFGSAVTTVYGCVDMSAVLLDTDTFVVDGALAAMTGATYKVEADSTTPSGDPWGTTIFSGVVPASGTLIFSLAAANMIQARYWRIKFLNGGAITYGANQIWLGKAIQFLNKSDRSWEPVEAATGGQIEVITKGGICTSYRTSRMLQKRAQVWNSVPETTASGTFLPALRDFMVNSNSLFDGIKFFWYVEDPTASPTAAKFVSFDDAKFDVMQVGPLATTLKFATTEQSY